MTTQPAPRTRQPAPAAQPTSPDHVGADAPQTDATATQAHGADPARSDAAERLPAAALSGAVKFYRVRANGSTRAVPYLPADSTAREVAEWVAWQVEDEGRTVAQVATLTGLSRATVRRALAGVELAEEIEAGDYDDLAGDDVDAIFLAHEAGEA